MHFLLIKYCLSAINIQMVMVSLNCGLLLNTNLKVLVIYFHPKPSSFLSQFFLNNNLAQSFFSIIHENSTFISLIVPIIIIPHGLSLRRKFHITYRAEKKLGKSLVFD